MQNVEHGRSRSALRSRFHSHLRSVQMAMNRSHKPRRSSKFAASIPEQPGVIVLFQPRPRLLRFVSSELRDGLEAMASREGPDRRLGAAIGRMHEAIFEGEPARLQMALVDLHEIISERTRQIMLSVKSVAPVTGLGVAVCAEVDRLSDMHALAAMTLDAVRQIDSVVARATG